MDFQAEFLIIYTSPGSLSELLSTKIQAISLDMCILNDSESAIEFQSLLFLLLILWPFQ